MSVIFAHYLPHLMAVRMVSPKEDAIVVRHNALVEASYTLSLVEKKVLLWLLSEIQPEDEDFQPMEVHLSSLCRFIGIENSNNRYIHMRPILANLKKKSALVIDRKTNKGTNQTLVTSWFSSVLLDEAHDTATFRVDPELKPYLLDLRENFTKIHTRYALLLDGFYAIRMYELLCQYRTIGRREITLTRLRNILGIEDGKFKLYGDFRRFVLDRAAEQTRKKADITFTYEAVKTGRKVTSLIFHIIPNTPEMSLELLDNANTPEGKARRRLMKLGLSEQQATKWVEDKGEEYTNAIAKIVEDRIKQGKADNPRAILTTALKEDWRIQKSLFEQELEDERKQEKERKRQAREAQERAIEEKRQQEEQEQRKAWLAKVTAGRARYEAMAPDEQQAAIKAFKAERFVPKGYKEELVEALKRGDQDHRAVEMFFAQSPSLQSLIVE